MAVITAIGTINGSEIDKYKTQIRVETDSESTFIHFDSEDDTEGHWIEIKNEDAVQIANYILSTLS